MKDKRPMEKTIHSRDYATLLRLLKKSREDAGITQVELAERLGQTQSFVSKIERGESRLDILQLRTILKHLGMSLSSFVTQLETELAKRR